MARGVQSMRVYTVGIVGEASYQDAIDHNLKGEDVFLVPEPDNPHDPRAVRVDNHRGQTIGYLPRNGWLTEVLLDEGKVVTAVVERVSREGRSGNLGVVLEVTIHPIGAAAPQAQFSSRTEAAKYLAKVFLGCLGLLVIVAAVIAAIGAAVF